MNKDKKPKGTKPDKDLKKDYNEKLKIFGTLDDVLKASVPKPKKKE